VVGTAIKPVAVATKALLIYTSSPTSLKSKSLFQSTQTPKPTDPPVKAAEKLTDPPAA